MGATTFPLPGSDDTIKIISHQRNTRYSIKNIWQTVINALCLFTWAANVSMKVEESYTRKTIHYAVHWFLQIRNRFQVSLQGSCTKLIKFKSRTYNVNSSQVYCVYHNIPNTCVVNLMTLNCEQKEKHLTSN